MKSVFSTILIASALAAPFTSFAQTANDPVTRSEVHAEVAAAEQNGSLHQSKVHYPSQQQPTQIAATVDTTSYGAPMAGSTQSREAISAGPRSSLFLHH